MQIFIMTSEDVMYLQDRNKHRTSQVSSCKRLLLSFIKGTYISSMISHTHVISISGGDSISDSMR